MKAAMYAIIKKDFRIVASNRRLFPALFIVPLVLTMPSSTTAAGISVRARPTRI